jgi:LuxR family maltose regulon positive regulatory protein
LSLHGGRLHRQLKLYLLDAQLQQAKGQRNAAHRSLRKSLQLAQPEGFVRAFLDEGESVLRLLREEYQTVLDASTESDAVRADRAFIETLLQASGIDLSRAPQRDDAPPQDPLTDREKEILSFLANGVSNKEMASRVFLSENTVKFHLKNIYSKLSVGSRLQAIAAARQRGLIH